MRLLSGDPQRSPIVSSSGPPRTAALVFYRELVGAARKRAICAGVICAAVVAAWLWFADGDMASVSFLGVGFALLWGGEVIHTWWQLRQPEALRRATAADAEAALAAASAAHAGAVAAHQEVLATHPPRVTYWLLACIVVVSVLQLAGPGESIDVAGLVKPAVFAGEWWRILTATYMHVGVFHLWMNASALYALGPIVEAYDSRIRLPLVYLMSALCGSLASVLLLPKTSVGASGGIMGVVAFLLVLARRQPNRVPPWLQRGALISLALTAYLGLFGFAFIDNAAHGGGALAGAAVGALSIPHGGEELSPARVHMLGAVGAASAGVLVLGAAWTVSRLLQTW